MACRVDVTFPVLDASLKIAESVCEVDMSGPFCVSVVFDQVGCMGSIIKLFLESCLISSSFRQSGSQSIKFSITSSQVIILSIDLSVSSIDVIVEFSFTGTAVGQISFSLSASISDVLVVTFSVV